MSVLEKLTMFAASAPAAPIGLAIGLSLIAIACTRRA